MGDINTALNTMIAIANDDSHGYSQVNRYGPDYDCSSLIAKALIDGGFNISKFSTTRNLYGQLINNKFISIPISATRKAGDIFLAVGSHVVMCVDENRIVHASIDENGDIIGAKSGDQTGKEICIRSYYNHPWDYHMRYEGTYTPTKPDNNYVVGNDYTLQANMCVRTGPGTTYRAKTHDELSADGRRHDKDMNGCLDAGTVITAINVTEKGNDIWIQSPSGWMAAVYNGEVYIK